jgi:hypothetical protein
VIIHFTAQESFRISICSWRLREMATFSFWILMFIGDLMAPLDIRVYRKPTHTNLYLNAKSHHHLANKLVVIHPGLQGQGYL